MTGGGRKLVGERGTDFDERHAAAMREATIMRRYRAAYFGIGMIVVVLVLWGLRAAGLI